MRCEEYRCGPPGKSQRSRRPATGLRKPQLHRKCWGECLKCRIGWCRGMSAASQHCSQESPFLPSTLLALVEIMLCLVMSTVSQFAKRPSRTRTVQAIEPIRALAKVLEMNYAQGMLQSRMCHARRSNDSNLFCKEGGRDCMTIFRAGRSL